MNEPNPFDPTYYLLSREHQITAPHTSHTLPLPPVRLTHRIWEHVGRIAPGLVTTAASALAWAWHERLPEGSTEPLWISGALAALAAAAGTVSAAKRHGDSDTTRLAFAAGGALALVGVSAWTPDWPLRTLLWLLGTAAVYAVCAPLWRGDRRLEREQQHERVMEETRGRNEQALVLIEGHTRLAEAQWRHRTETVRLESIGKSVQALVAASEARTSRAVAPGDELDVAALLRAAGHEAPVELTAAERQERQA
ncbi:hypothetical protein [Streptomyces mobaraensis]|uniref:Uncharacterized protein n=1 Tax=Streptomyces mobaraensis TaxID=35621 RepID=A0A5N5VXM4_STRMB|nr:hypothetical protein [Streptomyces mobaraensis]KAB7833554.1 hypothetical protein FRZ00_33460 [Streptomyces mobaraensis]